MKEFAMTRFFKRICVIVLLFCLSSSAWAGKAPTCLKPFIEDVVEELTKAQRDELYLVVRAADATGKTGVIAVLLVFEGENGPEIAWEIADHINNPALFHFYATPQDAFKGFMGYVAIGADGTVHAPPGWTAMITKFGDAASFTNRLGAELDAFVADQISRRGGTVLAFQEQLNIPGSTFRLYDVTEACPSCTFKRLFHEDKNWTTLLTGAGDGRLVGLANEFDRDIIAHASSGFDSLHFDFNGIVGGQSGLIRDTLLLEFDNPTVTALVDADTLGRAKTAFQTAWNSGAIVTFH